MNKSAVTSIIPHFRPGMFSTYWRVVIKPHRWYVLSLTGLMLVSAALEVITVGMGVPLIEAATSGLGETTNPVVRRVIAGLQWLGRSATKEEIIFVLLILVSVVAILRAGTLLLQRYGTAIIAQMLRKETKVVLFRRILNATYAYLEGRSRGAIVYDINYPSERMADVITNLGVLVSSLFNGLLLVGFMFYLSPLATMIIAVLGGGWLFAWRRVLAPRVARDGKLIYEYDQKLSKLDVDAIDGIRVVKSHALENQQVSRQERILMEELEPRKRFALFSQGLLFVNEVTAGIVVIALGGLTFGLGLFSVSFSKLVVLLLCIRRASPALASVGQSYLQLQRELKSIEVIDDITNRTPQEDGGSDIITSVQRIDIQHLDFQYATSAVRTSQWGLRDINIEMKKGDVVALVGKTGSGKSTLTSLLLSFYRPQAGVILVNGIALENLDLTDWRRKIGLVSQDIFLFNDTIRQNIALWGDFSDDEIVRACTIAQFHDFVETLPEKYHTPVGDRGFKLSGGQCQRLAIARALLEKPQVLIFDEATSALDSLTERAVYEAMHSLKRDAIVVIIAHRLSTIKEADQIYVLESGRIVELGNHQKLMRQSGVYTQLYNEATLG